MKSNGHWDEANEEFYVSILANTNTMKAILNIKNKYQVNFKSSDSLIKLLGFNAKTYSASQESERVVDILSVNSILVNLDIISGSYVNGVARHTIYSFFPNVSPGHKVVENPKNSPLSTHNVTRNTQHANPSGGSRWRPIEFEG